MSATVPPLTIQRYITCSAGALTAILSLTTEAHAQRDEPNITFTKIVDTNTLVPGTTRNFGPTDMRSFSGGHVAFAEWIPQKWGYSGVYTNQGGGLRVVADLNTPMPGWHGNFSAFDVPAIGDEEIVFVGVGVDEPNSEVYLATYIERNGKLEMLADTNTPVPRGEGRFTYLAFPSVDAGRVVFMGWDEDNRPGLYEWNEGRLSVIVDTITPIPGGVGTFASFGLPDFRDGVVCFLGCDKSCDFQGVYWYASGVLEVVADTQTPIPGGQGTFRYFGFWPSANDGGVAFEGRDAPFQQGGVYLFRGSALEVVANVRTPSPCRSSEFTYFAGASVSGKDVAFQGAESTGLSGIFARFGGERVKVIDLLDRLDGKRINGLTVIRGFDGNQLAFDARFADGSRGIYVATIRGPGRCAPDMNCDGAFNYQDIFPFRVALLFPQHYAAVYPNCHIERADLNGDGSIDGLDIAPFVEVLLQQ